MKQKKARKPRNLWGIKPVQKPHSAKGYDRKAEKKAVHPITKDAS